MTTWLEANRLANLAAAQAHGDLGIDTSAPPIDVYGAIGDAEVVLMWRPMPRQFGAYVAERGSRPGILINNGLPHAAQRQTAGHELGHHRFRHGTRFDADLDVPIAHRAVWTTEEKTAEAFASWFLMPRKAVLAALARLGLELPQAPEDVYQLSLLLGTPYVSTLRHLPSLRLISPNLARKWATVPPGTIKAKLDPAAEAPPSRRPDVWLISPRFAGTDLTVHPGDRLVIARYGRGEVLGHPNWLTDLSVDSHSPQGSGGRAARHGAEGGLAVMEVRGNGVGERGRVVVSAPADDDDPAGQWELEIKMEGQRSGVARRWIS